MLNNTIPQLVSKYKEGRGREAYKLRSGVCVCSVLLCCVAFSKDIRKYWQLRPQYLVIGPPESHQDSPVLGPSLQLLFDSSNWLRIRPREGL